jgi:hypothetical protein
MGEFYFMKTLFVIGAGASAEIGMPTGYELKKNICDLLSLKEQRSTDKISTTSLFHFAFQILTKRDMDEKDKYLKAAKTISEGLMTEISIDNFIDKHSSDSYIVKTGKLAIALALLKNERSSSIFNKNDSINLSHILETWYIPCYQKITENCQLQDLPERLKDIHFIIFNYDRCFEYIFLYLFMKNYNIEKKDAYTILSNMNIYHPYGTIGDILNLRYGEEIREQTLISLSDKIRTFTETISEESQEYKNIVSIGCSVEQVVFLGFAYHKQNLQLLFPDISKTKFYCYGTGLGISDKERLDIYHKLLLGGQIPIDNGNCNIINKKCYDFFNEFRYSITFN